MAAKNVESVTQFLAEKVDNGLGVLLSGLVCVSLNGSKSEGCYG